MYPSTLTFILFALPVILILFYCIPSKGKHIFLIVTGLFLYGWGSPIRILFPAAYLFFDYGVGMLLQKFRDQKLISRIILTISVLLQAAAILFVRWIPAEGAQLLLPFGIAVYTLQGIGYLIGIYRRKHPAEEKILQLALYLFFFPILYAGPLFSYEEFIQQLPDRRYNILNLGSGLGLFVRGLAEKVILADTLGYIFQELRQTDPAGISMLTAWLTVTAFALYLYFELLGFSEMARGLARCFGMELPKNFGQPFFTESISTFMENWNISHVLWFQKNFRHFLFHGCKQKWLRYASIILMWALIGFWYGSTPLFLLWGTCIGMLIASERLFLGKIIQRNHTFGMLYTGIMMPFLWVLMFADNITETLGFWKAMLGFGNGLADRFGTYFFTSYLVFLLICVYIATNLFHNITERIAQTGFGKKIVTISPVLTAILLLFSIASMLYTNGLTMPWLLL